MGKEKAAFVFKPRYAGDKGEEKVAPFKQPNWFRAPVKPGPSQPPTFNSFRELLMAFRLRGPI